MNGSKAQSVGVVNHVDLGKIQERRVQKFVENEDVFKIEGTLARFPGVPRFARAWPDRSLAVIERLRQLHSMLR